MKSRALVVTSLILVCLALGGYAQVDKSKHKDKPAKEKHKDKPAKEKHKDKHHKEHHKEKRK